MKTTRRKYYVYAGYYELWITDKILRRPMVYISWHTSLENAIETAETFDPDAAVCLDKDLKDEYISLMSSRLEHLSTENFDKYIEETAFFNGNDYCIKDGLAECTLICLCKRCNCKLNTHDAVDIANWIQTKTGKPAKRIYSLLVNKTYEETANYLKSINLPID